MGVIFRDSPKSYLSLAHKYQRSVVFTDISKHPWHGLA